MTKRKERLLELQCEIYDAQSLIDGVYNSEDPKFSDLTEINERYNKLLIDMNLLIDIIDKEFD